MTAEKSLVCHACKSYVYACKNGRLTNSNDLAKFIEDHEFECEGKIEVWDESGLPPSLPGKTMSDPYDRDYCYTDYFGKGRKD